MIYQVHALVRLPQLTREEFFNHWKTVHGPLVLNLAADLRIVSYRQLHGVPPPAGGEEPYDGFAIVGFRDAEDFTAMLASPEGKAAARKVRADEAHFFDRAASSVSWTHEVAIL